MRMRVSSILVLVFGGLVFLSAGAMGVLAIFNAFDNTRNELAALLGELIGEAVVESTAYFQPLESLGVWLAAEVEDGEMQVTDPDSLKLVLAGALSSLPQGEAVTIQFPDGSGYYYDRTTATMRPANWRPAWRVSQRGVASEGVWVLRPSPLDGSHRPSFITSARNAAGEQIAAIGLRANLEPLSERLTRNAQFRGQTMTRFMLFNQRVVVAHPLLVMSDVGQRPTVNLLGDPFLEELYSGQRFPLHLVADIEDVETFVLRTESGEDRVFALTEDTTRRTGGTVSIGVHFEPGAGAPELRRFYRTMALGVAFVLLSVVIAILVGRRAARPIKEFAAAARMIQKQELDAVPPLSASRAIELDEAANAFNSMVDGLKEREKIRSLFGKYVPESVAQLLLKDENASRPQSATATVLFLDLAGFSTMSEKLDPAGIIDTLNAFFSDVVEIIEDEKGIVTQFQGDAVLAVFNAPVPDPDHGEHAIRAAVRIIETARGKTFAGQKLGVRIGINTGSLVAGAVGASQRVSYTVHGDSVNLAARLESLNKETGTELLIAESTKDLAPGFAYDPVGTFAVKGREEEVATYTFRTLPAVK